MPAQLWRTGNGQMWLARVSKVYKARERARLAPVSSSRDNVFIEKVSLTFRFGLFRLLAGLRALVQAGRDWNGRAVPRR